MAYDDEQYVRASMDLASNIHTLMDNDISAADIRDMVEQAIDEHEPEED